MSPTLKSIDAAMRSIATWTPPGGTVTGNKFVLTHLVASRK